MERNPLDWRIEPAHRPIKPVYIRKFVRLVKFGTGDEA